MGASGKKTASIIRLPLRQDKWPLLPTQRNGETAERRILGARIAAFLAALVFAFAAWLPWLVLTYDFGQQAQSSLIDGGTLVQGLPFFVANSGRYAPVPSDPIMRLMVILGRSWSVLSAAGVLLAPFLWLRSHTRTSRIALTLYGIWFLLATLFTAALDKFIFFPPAFLTERTVSVYAPQWSPGWGMWLALAALATGTFALATLIRHEWRSPRVSGRRVWLPIVRTRAGWVGIGLLTVGILLWGMGFMAIPWATVNCPITPITLNHFVSGGCAALDSGDALSYFARGVLPRDAWNLTGGIYPLYGVLVGSGLFLLIALWVRSPSRIICAWAALWLAGASAIAYLAYRGVGVILTINPVMSGQATGAWEGASGVTTTLLGLLFAWLGIIPLERAAAPTIPPHAASVPSTATPERPNTSLHLLTTQDDEFEITSLR